MSSFGVKNDPLSNLSKRALVISEKTFFFDKHYKMLLFQVGKLSGMLSNGRKGQVGDHPSLCYGEMFVYRRTVSRQTSALPCLEG